ncbi:hypothetical protein M2317_002927 [Microbacterium sp. ZKA21]|uniref:hypothetical protein n=1 Tax=Microbacterium sp. ZKA21 TaxID=3381694 RepID=UPI003D1FCE25
MMQAYILFLRREAETKAEPGYLPAPRVARARTRPTYASVLAELEVTQPEAARAVSGYVRTLRAECAEYRVKLKEADRSIAYLEGQVDALGGDDE